MTGTRVVLLGTGTPVPDPDRAGPATAIVAGERAFLVDAGANVLRRATQAAMAGQAPVAPQRIEHVFLTHLHSDHTVGLPELALGAWVLGRETPLHLYGPPGTAAMAEHLLAAYKQDIAMRTSGLEELAPDGIRIIAHEHDEAGEVYRDSAVSISAVPVQHGTWEHAFGYRFEAPDRTVVVSGDARPSAALVQACSGCDVLVHEVYAKTGYDQIPSSGFHAYHGAFHTSGVELGALAAEARPKLLVLHHQLFMGASPEVLLQEVALSFAGPTVSGEDLDVF
jgi:ribonuclease BN (tRNA processing enzyme)